MTPSTSSTLPIPIDLFVSKKHPDLGDRVAAITNSSGKIIFGVSRPRRSNSLLIFDASGSILISIHRRNDSSWLGYTNAEEDIKFRLTRKKKSLLACEMEVFLAGNGGSKPDFKLTGFPHQKSCTILKDDSIVAETSLLYKLHETFKICGRSKFRLTLFPGEEEHVAEFHWFFTGRPVV